MATKTILSGQAFNTIGDSHVVEFTVPLRGFTSINSIIVNTTGSDANRYLVLQVSTSKDAVVYTDFGPDETPYAVPTKSDFLMKFKLTRDGNDNTGVITLDDITIEGDYDASLLTSVLDLNGTIFGEIPFDDPEWNELWINLLHKLYHDDIVPEFITRNQGTNQDELLDADYIAYWKTVAYFFAYIITLGKIKIEGIRETIVDLKDFLRQKSALFCDEIDLSTLQYVHDYLLDEMRKRGTHLIFEKSADGAPVDGEFLRYHCSQECDEVLHEYVPRHLSGFNINNTSPIFRGAFGRIQLNKAPEFTQDIQSLSNYDLILPNRVSLVVGDSLGAFLTEVAEDNVVIEAGADNILFNVDTVRDVICIAGDDAAEVTLDLEQAPDDTPYNTEAEEDILVEDGTGLGTNEAGVKFTTCVSPNLGYMLTFWVRLENHSNNNIKVMVNTLLDGDVEGGEIGPITMDANPLTSSYNVLDGVGLPVSDKWFFVRAIVHPAGTFAQTEQEAYTSLATGKNGVWGSQDIVKAEWYILNKAAGDMCIWDIKLFPLTVDMSSVYVDTYNVLNVLVENRNRAETTTKIESNVRRYLVPYGTVYQPQYIPLEEEIFDNLVTEDGDQVLSELNNNLTV
jgi:hypothetical protein